jgi:predicted nicotinamide N-methyase
MQEPNIHTLLQDLVFEQYLAPNTTIELAVPHFIQLQTLYQLGGLDFPYWAKIWPSAIALAIFLQENPSYIQNKKLLELAAGIGLPSFVAAKYASHICCSDYVPAAIALLEKNIAANQLSNLSSALINWKSIPESIEAEVLLLSDINYNPTDFDTVFLMLQQFIQQGTTILLSTPQRLVAKDFIAKLLLWCVLNKEQEIRYNHKSVLINIFVLQNKELHKIN